MPKPTARFITFEGGEAAGKSTQINRVSTILTEQNIAHIVTREPGGCAGAEELRRLLLADGIEWTPLTEALLMYAARQEHLEHTIRPALRQGQWVLCDRFMDSTTAYQGYGHGVSLKFLQALADTIVAPTWPDLTLIFDFSAEKSISRLQSMPRGRDRIERQGPDFHTRLAAGFRQIAADHPQRCRLLNADQPIEAVTKDILAAMKL